MNKKKSSSSSETDPAQEIDLPPYAFLNPPLGALVGFLIAMPYNLTNADNFTDSFLTTFAVTLVGGFLGYNKRKSRVFLYVSLVCALVLMALLSFISSNPQVLKGNNGS